MLIVLMLPFLSSISADQHKYMDAYRHFINERETLDFQFIKFILLGLPRIGKTTARRRLTGEIADLRSAGEAEQPHPSTGVVDSRHSVVVRCVSNTTAIVTEESEWSSIKSHTEEVNMFLQALNENKIKPASADVEGIGSIPSSHPVMTVSESPESQPTVQAHPLHSGTPRESTEDTEEVLAMFTKVMGSKHWKEVKRLLKAHLRIEDAGGQPELMDMLPAFTIGSAVYLVFLNLKHDLQSLYDVTYCNSSGESSTPIKSTYTVEEMLLTALSSISCSNTSTTAFSPEVTTDPDLKKILGISKSIAYIVGTHKDQVSEQDIAEFDEKLQKLIRSTDFFEKDIVQFSSDDRLVVTMDNMDGGTEEINEIRKLLEAGMMRHFKKMTIPAAWLLFSVCLRMRDVRTTNLESCLQLSKQFKMTEFETKIALWFLHHHAGVMMYFPDIPELKDFVIIDPQVVYDSVTNLILRSLKSKEVGKAAAERFKKTGQFSLDDLNASIAKVPGDNIPPAKLVALLLYLHIIACIPVTDGEMTYIMTCVLENASKEELDSFQKNVSGSHSVAPIMIRYKCGFVPFGVFPAIIASLIGNKSLKLIKTGIKKNRVQFRHGPDRTLVTFMSWPTYYEIKVQRLPTAKTQPHEECVDITEIVKSTFERVSSRMNYGCFMDYQFSFECPSHPRRDHLCVVDSTEASPRFMDCLADHDNPEPILLEDHHLVWYGGKSDLKQ